MAVAAGWGGPTHEQLAFPGGYIVVPANLIVPARNEAELAGMLAHAVAHIAQRHGFRPATHSGEMPAWFVASGRHEIEADVLAVEMTSGAGYEPEAMVHYIGRTPQTGTRESRIAGSENVIRELPPKRRAVPR